MTYKYFSQEFSGDVTELVKQKGVHPYEYMGSLGKFSENKLPDRSTLYSSVKNKHISEKNIYMLSIFGIYLK